MTLGSLAMAADITTTVAPQWKTGLNGSDNNQCGLSFILTPEAVRYASLDETVLPAVGTAVTLTSIEIASGANQSGRIYPKSGLMPIITNDEGYLVAFGDTTGETVSRAKNTYYGGGWQFSRDFTTWSSFVAPDWSTTISLEVGKQYKIFFMDGEQSGELLQAIMGAQGEPVQVTQNYYKDTIRYFGGGTYTASTSSQYGFINPAGEPVTDQYAPMMAVTVTYTPQVPEPTTGTLSLLALAGLCIRRRK